MDMWVTAKVVARSVMGVVVEEGGFRACGDGGWGGGGSGVRVVVAEEVAEEAREIEESGG